MENDMDASAETLTVEQAYRAMLAFLEREVELTESSDLADLLAGYRLDDDGRTSDPALWDEWMEAVGQIRADKPA
jgi:hypothetical protein